MPAPSTSTSTDLINSAEISDAVFGTRSYTPGAAVQKPRKVPLRIEPKTYFANERTFLAWLHMAVTVGGVTTALAGYTASTDKHIGKPGRGISKETSEIITVVMVPLAILMIVYAMLTFYYRSLYLQKKQMGFYQDWYGPVAIAGCVMASLIFVLGLSIYDLACNGF